MGESDEISGETDDDYRDDGWRTRVDRGLVCCKTADDLLTG
jgi:hypothetical protein